VCHVPRRPVAAPPADDKAEVQAAFEAVHAAYPDVKVNYLGTDGKNHYFHEQGAPRAYAVPVSDGWKPTAQAGMAR
jgi:hypothetical protein